MREFVETLKRRAERFLVDAEADLESGEYDIALFHVEQAVQLFLKARILSFGVEFPKTHEISTLVKIAGELGVRGLGKLVRENRDTVELLDHAYISSRYLPISFSKKDVEKALEFARRIRDALWKKGS